MIIQNKKSQVREIVTEEQFQVLKDMGFSGNWTIVTREDVIPNVIPREVVEIKEFKAGKKRKPKKKTDGS